MSIQVIDRRTSNIPVSDLIFELTDRGFSIRTKEDTILVEAGAFNENGEIEVYDVGSIQDGWKTERLTDRHPENFVFRIRKMRNNDSP